MGKGIDLARGQAPLHASVLDDFKDQLLIVFLKRLQAKGDDLVFPVAEVDDTRGDIASFSVNDGAFHFKMGKKS